MVKPKTTWKNPDNYIKLIKDPWYKTIVEIQNIINLYTPQFYQSRNIKTLHLPVTTSAISSPMGLGSDSKPVQIDLFRNKNLFGRLYAIYA